MRLCRFTATAECNARPCIGCDPHGYSAEEIAEQERQAAEAAEIDEWLNGMTDEQISFIAWCADVDAAMADDADLHATQDCARM